MLSYNFLQYDYHFLQNKDTIPNNNFTDDIHVQYTQPNDKIEYRLFKDAVTGHLCCMEYILFSDAPPGAIKIKYSP